MAEAMAAVGLASSIATFLQIGLKVAKTGTVVLKSSQETPEEAYELSLIAQDIDRRIAEVSPLIDIQEPRKFGKEDHKRYVKNFQEMTAECKRLSSSLQHLLNSLVVKPDSRFPKWQAVRVSIRAVVKEKDMENLRARLERLEGRLHLHGSETMGGLRYRDLMDELRNLRLSHEQYDIHSPKLKSMREDIERLTRDQAVSISTQRRIVEEFAQNQASGISALSDNLTSLKTKLAAFVQDHELYEHQLQMVKSLHFPEIRVREFQINNAHINTEKWVFVSSHTTFSNWLENGNGIYWVKGLAGSGKSTLMKFRCRHPNTQRGLRVWGGDSEIHTADFFFWNQGHAMEKSLHGLFQSLLYQILRKIPSYIPDTCGAHPDYEEWEFSELKTMLRKLMNKTGLSMKFCFFIDGLDEYDGDVQDVIDILKLFSKSKHIKICASSRPWPALETAFQDSRKELIVQDFTRDDMKIFVQDHVTDNPTFQRLKKTEPRYQSLVDEIATRARGVWLWVVLVTKDLKTALAGNEDYDTLKEILNGLPPDLSAYFKRIVGHIRPVFRKDMARAFLIAITAASPIPLYAMTFLDKEWHQVPVKAVTARQVDDAYVKWKGRIHNRCGDLLLVRKYDDTNTLFKYRLDFLHKTVRDWLRENQLRTLQNELRVQPFNAAYTLCELSLCLLKVLPDPDFRATSSNIPSILGEILEYAHELKDGPQKYQAGLFEILDRIDWTNYAHASVAVPAHHHEHWTSRARVMIHTRAYNIAGEADAMCNFLAFAVQAGLVGYVRAKLESRPELIKKAGRPLLDYALFPRLQLHKEDHTSTLEVTKIDVSMVQLLLEKGAFPNDRSSSSGHTAWGSFLLACSYFVTKSESIPDDHWATWLQTARLLIEHGAGRDCFDPRGYRGFDRDTTVPDLLRRIFVDEAGTLICRIDELERQTSWMSWLTWKFKFY